MKVVIAGAASAIAHETARLFAAEQATLVLIGRTAEKLESVAADLRVRGAASVNVLVTDLADTGRHSELVGACGGEIDAVLLAHGSLPDQNAIDRDAAAQVAAFELNATSVISLAARFATVLESQGRGTLAVIGSVAGDRGRRSNYLYGAAKAAVHAYCEGLRLRLAAAGAHVLLIKPGWVDTPMTASIRKNALFASAASVGAAIHRAIRERRDTIYVPGFWRWISLVLRLLPWRMVKF